MQPIIHPMYPPLERMLITFLSVSFSILAWLLIKCLEKISDIDKDCFV